MSETCTYMTQAEILDTIYNLSKSQGLYCRVYDSIKTLEKEDPEQYKQYMEHLQQQHFKDPVDLVLYFEC